MNNMIQAYDANRQYISTSNGQPYFVPSCDAGLNGVFVHVTDEYNRLSFEPNGDPVLAIQTHEGPVRYVPGMNGGGHVNQMQSPTMAPSMASYNTPPPRTETYGGSLMAATHAAKNKGNASPQMPQAGQANGEREAKPPSGDMGHDIMRTASKFLLRGVPIRLKSTDSLDIKITGKNSLTGKYAYNNKSHKSFVMETTMGLEEVLIEGEKAMQYKNHAQEQQPLDPSSVIDKETVQNIAPPLPISVNVVCEPDVFIEEESLSSVRAITMLDSLVDSIKLHNFVVTSPVPMRPLVGLTLDDLNLTGLTSVFGLESVRERLIKTNPMAWEFIDKVASQAATSAMLKYDELKGISLTKTSQFSEAVAFLRSDFPAISEAVVADCVVSMREALNFKEAELALGDSAEKLNMVVRVENISSGLVPADMEVDVTEVGLITHLLTPELHAVAKACFNELGPDFSGVLLLLTDSGKELTVEREVTSVPGLDKFYVTDIKNLF